MESVVKVDLMIKRQNDRYYSSEMRIAQFSCNAK